jgi:hypothetical protein
MRREGCPIRTPADRPVCAGPRGFSQLAASFFASGSLGIPRAPLSTWTDARGPLARRTRPRGALSPASSAQHVNELMTGKTRHKGETAEVHVGGGGPSRKEVFQPHLPVRLPCYDLAPVTGFTLSGPLRLPTSGPPGSHGLTGGVYKVRERIHRAVADARLLAIPASRGRVADPDPN